MAQPPLPLHVRLGVREDYEKVLAERLVENIRKRQEDRAKRASRALPDLSSVLDAWVDERNAELRDMVAAYVPAHVLPMEFNPPPLTRKQLEDLLERAEKQAAEAQADVEKIKAKLAELDFYETFEPDMPLPTVAPTSGVPRQPSQHHS